MDEGGNQLSSFCQSSVRARVHAGAHTHTHTHTHTLGFLEPVSTLTHPHIMLQDKRGACETETWKVWEHSHPTEGAQLKTPPRHKNPHQPSAAPPGPACTAPHPHPPTRGRDFSLQEHFSHSAGLWWDAPRPPPSGTSVNFNGFLNGPLREKGR